jgi:hypothetical protein
MLWRKKTATPLDAGVEPPRELPAVATPLFAAAQYVTIVSGGGRPDVLVSRIYDPVLCNSPSEEGVCFLMESDEGKSGKMFFFSGFASAWPDGETTPRPQIPTEMIAARVSGYTDALRSLLIMIPRGIDRIARVMN